MTPKQILYSAHAAKRLRERRITRQQVRTVLAIGTLDDAENGGLSKTAVIDGRTIRVIYREYPSTLHIWTVMLVPRD